MLLGEECRERQTSKIAYSSAVKMEERLGKRAGIVVDKEQAAEATVFWYLDPSVYC